MKVQEYGILVAIATAVTTFIRFLYLKSKEYQGKYRALLNADWINEGSIGGNRETHYVSLSLKVDPEDGEITGIIQSRTLADDSDWRLSVNGRLKYKSAFITFTKVTQGRVSVLGKAKISFVNTKNLDWTIIDDPNGFFPIKTQLWKSQINLFDDLSNG